MSEANERPFLFGDSPQGIAIEAKRRWQSLFNTPLRRGRLSGVAHLPWHLTTDGTVDIGL